MNNFVDRLSLYVLTSFLHPRFKYFVFLYCIQELIVGAARDALLTLCVMPAVANTDPAVFSVGDAGSSSFLAAAYASSSFISAATGLADGASSRRRLHRNESRSKSRALIVVE
jgi:hypothetical protein